MTSSYLEKAILDIAAGGARKYQKQFALERLEKLRTDLLEEIDGGDECRGRDTRISEMIRDVEYIQGQVGAIK